MSNVLRGQIFPLDPTGKLPSNKITDEFHVITASNWRSYHFIVPKKGPYFEDSLVMTYKNTAGMVVPLVLGKDWVPSYWFIGASRACAKQIFGGITFLNTELTGNIKISYQTIGGEWVLDDQAISEILAEHLKNPLTTSWEVIAKVPKIFPPEPHEWNLVDMVGAKDVVDVLQQIVEVLRLQSLAGLQAHLADHNNPHGVTKEQIMLGLVQNLGLVPLETARQEVGNNYYVTPASARLIIADAVGDAFIAWTKRRDNPQGITAEQTGAYSKDQINTLLDNKLSVTDIAFDTSRFNGMTFAEAKTDILTGTSANALKFAGRTYGELIKDLLIQVTAKDKFGGRTPDENKDWVLEGTAANSVLFNGKTETQLAQYYKDNKSMDAYYLNGRSDEETKTWILEGKAADAAKFNSKSYDDLVSDVKAAVGTNALTLNGKQYAELIVDARNGKVKNSEKFGGYDLNEYAVEVLKGKSADSYKFGGRTPDENKDWVLEGTAADAAKLNGKTYTQIIAEAKQSVQSTLGDATSFGGRTPDENKDWVLEGTAADAAKLNGETADDIIQDALTEGEHRFTERRVLQIENDLTNNSDRVLDLLHIDTSFWNDDNQNSYLRFDIDNLFDSKSDSDTYSENNIRATVSISIAKMHAGDYAHCASVNFSVLGNTSDLGLTATKITEIAAQLTLGYYINTNDNSFNICIKLPYNHSTATITYFNTNYKGMYVAENPNNGIDGSFLTSVQPMVLTFSADKADVVYNTLNSKISDVITDTNNALTALDTSANDNITSAIANEVSRANNAYATKDAVATISNGLNNTNSILNKAVSGETIANAVVVTEDSKLVTKIDFTKGDYIEAYSYNANTATGKGVSANISSLNELNIIIKPKKIPDSIKAAGGKLIQYGSFELAYKDAAVINWLGSNIQWLGGVVPTLTAGKIYLFSVMIEIDVTTETVQRIIFNSMGTVGTIV